MALYAGGLLARVGTDRHLSGPKAMRILLSNWSNREKLKKTERRSPTLGAPAPSGAVVLFDGSEPLCQNGKAVRNARKMVGLTLA